MTKQEEQLVLQTTSTAGWGVIRARAAAAIEHMKLEALVNTEESRVLELWRNAQAAHRILNIFLDEVENPQAGIGQESE